MKRHSAALITIVIILIVVCIGSCLAARARTLRAAEGLAAVFAEEPDKLDTCLKALLGAFPTREAAAVGAEAAEEQWHTTYPFELFTKRIWSPALLYSVGAALLATAVGAALFLAAERRKRIRYEERLNERVNAALRGEESFRAERPSERLTARLLAEIERLRAVREDSAEELRVYVENVAHELKTPASGLILNLDLIEKNGLTQEKLSVTRRCAMRISSYVAALLSLARMRAGKVRFTFEPVDTLELVNEIAEDLVANGVLVEVSGEGALINGDRVRIKEAVQNLMINAAKHSAEGEPVRVKLTSTGVDAAISIINNGGGTAEGFSIERYSVGSEDGTSSGIGLSLAQAVASRHSGKLNIRFDENGSEAELVIPTFSLKKSYSE